MYAIKEFCVAVDKRLYFIFLCSISLLLTFIFKELVIGDEVYYATFGQQLTTERINQFLAIQHKWEWVTYAAIPLLYLIKLSAVAFCLNVGCIMINYDLNFKRLFQISLIAETVFVVPAFIKIIWFWNAQQNYTLQDLMNFSPLSLLNFYSPDSVRQWLIYPLQVLNVFEIIYWLILAYGLKLVLQKPFLKTVKLVLSSYGTGLVMWITFIIFLQLNYS